MEASEANSRPVTEGVPLDRILFGGSFDPPHYGHFTMVEYVLKNGYAKRLDFIPAAVSPFKMNETPAPPEARLEMLRVGTEESISSENRKNVSILDLELLRPPPSFTFETCRQLREQYPEEEIGLLIGSDSFPHFGKWKNSGEILKYHPLIVFMRTGDRPERLRSVVEALVNRFADIAVKIHLLDNPWIDCSSTCIKSKVMASEKKVLVSDLRNCLPPGVLSFIIENDLYHRAERGENVPCP